jgi:hypothetical protein
MKKNARALKLSLSGEHVWLSRTPSASAFSSQMLHATAPHQGNYNGIVQRPETHGERCKVW